MMIRGVVFSAVMLFSSQALAAPTIVSVNPASGPEEITPHPVIKGTNFQTGALVYVGGVIARGSFNCKANATTCMVFIPPLTWKLGPADVKVVNPDGSTATLTGGWSYTTASLTPKTCSFNGKTIASGSTVKAYKALSVSYWSNCSSQIRTCTNGDLSGTYTHSLCTVQAPIPRDALQWPFPADSIWNMPIGSGAVYKPANLVIPSGSDPTDMNPVPYIDQDVLVLKPDSKPIPLYYNGVGWNDIDKDPDPTKNRCEKQANDIVAMIPWPATYILPSTGRNNSTAVLLEDGHTYFEMEPTSHCAGIGYVTSGAHAVTDYGGLQDIKTGDGIRGSHGGSHLSALGGSLRVGELTRAGSPPRHALKLAINSQGRNYCGGKPMSECKRWPAYVSNTTCPSGGSGECSHYGLRGTQHFASYEKMGSLLAIHKDVNINSLGLETEPGKMLAWTLQNYGAYDVDTTAHYPSESFAVMAEENQDGDFATAFQAAWGYTFTGRVKNRSENPFLRDVEKIVRILQVIDNNGPDSIGGGGTPRQKPAPPFK